LSGAAAAAQEAEEGMNVPGDLKYSKTHEWIRVEGDTGTVGISDFAQQELGDIVFVEAPASGSAVEVGGPMGSVESVKAVSELNAPVAGTVAEVNDALADHPELLNQDPYGQGWIAKIKLSAPGDLGGLMDAAAYTQYIADSAH
jgi:glycine cleavage system H protein